MPRQSLKQIKQRYHQLKSDQIFYRSNGNSRPAKSPRREKGDIVSQQGKKTQNRISLKKHRRQQELLNAQKQQNEEESFVDKYCSCLVPKKKNNDNGIESKYKQKNDIIARIKKQTRSKQGKKTLILDLDETLVHASFKRTNNPDFILNVIVEGYPYRFYISKRPYVEDFIETLSKYYEIFIFTASLQEYGEGVVKLLNIEQHISEMLFRQDCVQVGGSFIKDIVRIPREQKDMIIVDNSATCFAFQPENGFLIKNYYDDPEDKELCKLIPFLKFLSDVDDVRDIRKLHQEFQKQLPITYKSMSKEEKTWMPPKEMEVIRLSSSSSSCSSSSCKSCEQQSSTNPNSPNKKGQNQEKGSGNQIKKQTKSNQNIGEEGESEDYDDEIHDEENKTNQIRIQEVKYIQPVPGSQNNLQQPSDNFLLKQKQNQLKPAQQQQQQHNQVINNTIQEVTEQEEIDNINNASPKKILPSNSSRNNSNILGSNSSDGQKKYNFQQNDHPIENSTQNKENQQQQQQDQQLQQQQQSEKLESLLTIHTETCSEGDEEAKESRGKNNNVINITSNDNNSNQTKKVQKVNNSSRSSLQAKQSFKQQQSSKHNTNEIKDNNNTITSSVKRSMFANTHSFNTIYLDNMSHTPEKNVSENTKSIIMHQNAQQLEYLKMQQQQQELKQMKSVGMKEDSNLFNNTNKRDAYSSECLENQFKDVSGNNNNSNQNSQHQLKGQNENLLDLPKKFKSFNTLNQFRVNTEPNNLENWSSLYNQQLKHLENFKMVDLNQLLENQSFVNDLEPNKNWRSILGINSPRNEGDDKGKENQDGNLVISKNNKFGFSKTTSLNENKKKHHHHHHKKEKLKEQYQGRNELIVMWQNQQQQKQQQMELNNQQQENQKQNNEIQMQQQNPNKNILIKNESAFYIEAEEEEKKNMEINDTKTNSRKNTTETYGKQKYNLNKSKQKILGGQIPLSIYTVDQNSQQKIDSEQNITSRPILNQ